MLVQLEVDLPPLRPSGCTVRVRNWTETWFESAVLCQQLGSAWSRLSEPRMDAFLW